MLAAWPPALPAAARARRLDETAQITLIERGPDVSFANCGLPYFIGGEIKQRDALAVQTPQTLKAMLALDVRTSTEAIAIDRAGKRVQVARGRQPAPTSGCPTTNSCSRPAPCRCVRPCRALMIRASSRCARLQDMDRIKAAAANAQRVAVIGAGFIGLEMAEQFVRLGKQVTLVEMLDQVLPPLDRPMTRLMEDELAPPQRRTHPRRRHRGLCRANQR